jgi:protein O-mannosyl-transferase
MRSRGPEDAPRQLAPPRHLRRWERARTGAAALILVAAGLVAYGNGSSDRFTGLDARESIRDNPHIQQLWPLSEAMSLSLLKETLAVDPGSKGGSVVRRPFLSLTFALNYRLLGPEPQGFFAVNLALHLCAGLLLLGVVRRTLEREPLRARYGSRALGIALAVATLWTVHPVQTESVTYVVQRAEGLMGFFYLLTMYCAVRGFSATRRGAWYVASIVSCALGMATKETMGTAPLLVLLYDVIFVSPSLAAALKRRPGYYTALAATWLIPAALIVMTLNDATRDFTEGRNLAYALAQLRVVLHYVRLALWPHPLYLYVNTNLHLFRSGVTPVLPYVASGLILAVFIGGTVWGVVRRQWFGFVGAWFFLILAPSSSFIAATDTIQEHRLYLSLAAVIVILVIGGDALVRRLARPLCEHTVGRIEALLVSLGIVTLVVLTRNRNAAYGSEFGAIYPADRPEALSILASHELAHGNLQGALNAFDELIGEMPERIADGSANAPAGGEALVSSANLHYTFANVLCRNRYFEAAKLHFDLATHTDPQLAVAHNNLGALLAMEGDFSGARPHLEAAIRVRPEFPQAHRNLGLLHLREGDVGRARQELEAALAFAPGFEGPREDLAWLAGAQQEGALPEAFALIPSPPFCYPDIPITLQRAPLPEMIGRGR